MLFLRNAKRFFAAAVIVHQLTNSTNVAFAASKETPIFQCAPGILYSRYFAEVEQAVAQMNADSKLTLRAASNSPTPK
jgi:hypothetical protein